MADWSILEPGICIVAGCIATYRPLFSRCGFTERATPSYRSPVTVGRRSRNTQGLSFAFTSGNKNVSFVCGSVSHHTNRNMHPQPALILENKDMEMDDLERKEGIFADRIQNEREDREQYAINQADNDSIWNNNSDNATTPIPTLLPTLRASNDLSLLSRHAYISPFTSSPRLQISLQERQLQQGQYFHQQNIEEPSVVSPPSPIIRLSPLPVPPPPCRILVQTATKVEFGTTPLSVMAMPAVPVGNHSATASSLVTDEPPTPITLHRGHSIHISGSVSDTTQTSEN